MIQKEALQKSYFSLNIINQFLINFNQIMHFTFFKKIFVLCALFLCNIIAACDSCGSDGYHSCKETCVQYLQDFKPFKSFSKGHWKNDDPTPKSSFEYVRCYDLGKGESDLCEMCLFATPRYIHEVEKKNLTDDEISFLKNLFNHTQLDEENKILTLKVGCICAAWLTGDMYEVMEGNTKKIIQELHQKERQAQKNRRPDNVRDIRSYFTRSQ
jgi:hypothetical protein